jgi:uncharacterized protein VirK/YbjX
MARNASASRKPRERNGKFRETAGQFRENFRRHHRDIPREQDSPQMSSLKRFARSLTGRVRHRGVLGACKYTARSLLQWHRHAAWLAFAETQAPMAQVVQNDPPLLERYQHRFISLRMSPADRLAALASHYAVVLRYFPPVLVRELYVGREVRLGALPLRDGGMVDVVLKAPPLRGREGELGIYLVDEAGLHPSYAVITFADDGRTVLVGCLQGAAASAGREAVRDLTRRSHGLRPKNLLLSMIHAMAARVGAERIRAVGNAVHPFAGVADKIKADYDGFWLENGGVRGKDGMFDLPATEPMRDVAQVESKHRSAFRKREALRLDACALVSTAIGMPREAVPIAA